MSARYYAYFTNEELDEISRSFDDVGDAIEARDEYVLAWPGTNALSLRIAILDWDGKTVIGRFLTDEEIAAEAKAISEFIPKKDAYMEKFVSINAPFLYGKISKEERDDRIKAEAGPYPEGTYFSDMPIEQFVILADPRHVNDEYVPQKDERLYTLINGEGCTYYQVGHAYVDVLGTYVGKDLGYPDRTVIG